MNKTGVVLAANDILPVGDRRDEVHEDISSDGLEMKKDPVDDIKQHQFGNTVDINAICR